MKYEIDNEIKSGLNKKVYLLFGDEKYLVNKYKNKLINTLIPLKEDIDTELTIFDGEKSNAYNIMEALELISFTGGRRIVLVTNSSFFYRGKTNDAEEISKFLDIDYDNYVLIFIETNVDKRSKLYKQVKKLGTVEEFTNLKADQISTFISNLVKEKGSKISDADARYLSVNLYNDLENVISEVEKLCSYKINDLITTDDIDLLCSKNLEVRVFELVDKIGQKDAKSSIDIFNNMLLIKESPLMVLTMIGRTFKNLLICKNLLESGYTESEIASKTKIHPFVVKKNITTSRNFKKVELYNSLFEVLELDEKIKTGQIKDTIAVESIILKYSKKN